MVECFNMGTAHLFGDALASQFRLRHRIFIRRTNYFVPTWKGMEYDQYDTPAASYLVSRDDAGEVRGIARLSPTDRPYMLADVWPEMVRKIELPRSTAIWEGTRFGVDKDLPSDVRRRLVAKLVMGYLQFGLSSGVEGIIGVMPTLIWRAVFSANGWPVEFLGDAKVLGGDKCVAGLLRLSEDVLDRVSAKTGLSGRVIVTADDIGERKAA